MHQSIGKKNKIIIYLLFLFILSTTSAKFINDQKKLSSSISKINITGLSEIKNLEILNNLNNFLYKSIFVINEEEIKKILEKHNIIQEFSIKKIYPSTLNIKIKPTKLIARVSNNSQYLVGANGKLIEDKSNNELLPYIFGEFNSQDFLSFKKNIEKSMWSFSNLKELSFFPSGRWDILTDKDILIKLPQEHIVASLNLSKELINNNNFKDFFYKRLIFPIANIQGKVVGFGGRVLNNSNPKYINSPESDYFKKRDMLYNLNLAKDSARQKKNLLICEGYMDVISLFQNNIKSVVAPLGTAFTEEQLKLSWRYTDRPTIMFDGDEAGRRASFKARHRKNIAKGKMSAAYWANRVKW